MYMPGVSRPFVGLSSDLISFRIAAYSRLVRPCKLQGWKLDWLALTARVRDGATHVRSSYRRPLLHGAHWIYGTCARARARLREKENPSENASASNRRASNRTRRGARQPADTIVTGCINPPSWYPQGRASNPKVNALDSNIGRPPPPPLRRWLLFLDLPRPPSTTLSLLATCLFLSPFLFFFIFFFIFVARWRRVSLALACGWDGESHLATSGMSLPLIPPIRLWPESVEASGRLPHFPPLLLSLSLCPASSSPLPSSSSSTPSILRPLLLVQNDKRRIFREHHRPYPRIKY